MNLWTLTHSPCYQGLNKKCKAISGKTMAQLIYIDCNILINNNAGLNQIATFLKKKGYQNLAQYVRELIEFEKLDKRIKRIQQGEYLFERDYSTAVKAISMTECRTRIKR